MKIAALFLSGLAAVAAAPSKRERDIYARAFQNRGDIGIAPALERRNNTGGHKEKTKSTVNFSNPKAKDYYGKESPNLTSLSAKCGDSRWQLYP